MMFEQARARGKRAHRSNNSPAASGGKEGYACSHVRCVDGAIGAPQPRGPARARALRHRQEQLAQRMWANDGSEKPIAFLDEFLRDPADTANHVALAVRAMAPDAARDQADVRVAAPASPFPAVADLVEAWRSR